MHQENQSDL